MPLKDIIVDREFGLADHIDQLWKRVQELEKAVFPPKKDEPFVYTEGWDTGYGHHGYGIDKYTEQSFNPDAATLYIVQDNTSGADKFVLYRGSAVIGEFGTMADAEAAKKVAEAN